MRKEEYKLSKEFISLLNELPIAICVLQKFKEKSLFIDVNKAAESLFEMKKNEIIKLLNCEKYSKVFLHDMRKFKKRTEELFEGNPEYDLTYKIKLSSDDDYTYLNEKGNIIKMEDGTCLGIVAISNVSKQVGPINAKKELSDIKYNCALKKIARANTNLIASIQIDFTLDKVVGGDFSGSIVDGDKCADIIKKEKEKIINFNERIVFNEKLTPENLNECAHEGKTISLEYRRKSLADKGKSIWVRNDINFSINPINKHVFAYVYLYDIDEKKETERFLKYTSTYNYDFVQRVDLITDNYTTFISSRFRDKFLSRIDGFDYFNRFLNDSVFEFDFKIIGDNLKKEKLIMYLADNVEYTKNFTVTDENNELRYKRITFRYLDNSEDTLCVMQQDFTQSMIAEIDKNIKLESALNSAEKANKVKSNFLAKMSHDMRTPMNVIKGLSDFGYEESNEPKIKEYFNQIISSSDFLINLLNDLLDVNKLENGSLRLNEDLILLSELTEEVLNLIRPRAEDKNLKLSIEGQYVIDENYYIIDKHRMQQVLLNILCRCRCA